MNQQDEQHLKLLSIFHYIVGGLAGLFALIPIIHLLMGLMFVCCPETFGEQQNQQPPAFIGWFMVIFAGTFITAGWILAGCILAVGRCLSLRRRYLFCLVMAGIECVFMPFGTVLGVFTILVLMRDSVKESFTSGSTIHATG